MPMWHHGNMPTRPMNFDESAYLSEYKASLDEAWRGFWLTLGLWGLPAGFFVSSVVPNHGGVGDRLAIALAGAILFALVGAIVSYSPQTGRARRLGLTDLNLPGRLEEDLLVREVEEERVTITAKA